MTRVTTLFTLLITFFSLVVVQAQSNIPPLPQMITVEGGEFTMGCSKKDAPCDKDERPAHTVKLNTFLISKYEVSTAEYRQFAAETKTKLPTTEWKMQDNLPITNVLWEEAVLFCNWLSTKQGLKPAYIRKGNLFECDFSANGFRLPTEAEWEFAARGGKKSLGYAFSGSDDLTNIAWVKANSNGAPHPYGTKMPNELGIHDMSGNVWEWCWDWHNMDYYKMENYNNPKGPINGEKKIVRGGSWDSVSSYARLSNRISTSTDTTYPFYGFRVVRSK